MGILLITIPCLSAQKHVFTQMKMGSPFTITIDAKDTINLNRKIALAFNEVDRLEMIFSNYIKHSEINKINQEVVAKHISMSNELCDLMIQSKNAYDISNGAFDITIGKSIGFLKNYKKSSEESIMDSIKYYLANVSMSQVNIDEKKCILIKMNQNIQFDFGGIAKGYIAQKISDWLKQNKLPRHLIDAGGDLVVGKAPKKSKGWAIAIQSLDENINDVIYLQNKAIATSGSKYQNFNINNLNVSHILDPINDTTLASTKQSTIIADKGQDADWIATACLALNTNQLLDLSKSVSKSSIILSSIKNGAIETKYYGKKINSLVINPK